MRLIIFAILLLAVTSEATRHKQYKTKRIIKVRVPPRQHLTYHAPHKIYARPVSPYYPHKEYHGKYPDHIRTYSYASGFHLKPRPHALNPAGYTKEAHKKIPLLYGSSFPHKTSSTFRFPSGKDEFRVTSLQTGTTAAAVPVSTVQHFPPSPTQPSTFSTFHQPTSYYDSSFTHFRQEDRNPIKEIPAPNLAAKPYDYTKFATYGKGPSIDVTNLVKDTGGQLSFPASEYYAAFGQTGNTESYDTGNVYNDYDPAAVEKNNVTPAPSAGYEVTESQPSGDGGDVSDQFYYAPDPDPGQPVHKVPPTNVAYTDNYAQNFQILEGGSVQAPVTTLTPQELYSLMHGYQTQALIPQQQSSVVTVLGQPQGVYLQPNYAYQTQLGQNQQYGDLSQYFQQNAPQQPNLYLQQSNQQTVDVGQYYQQAYAQEQQSNQQTVDIGQYYEQPRQQFTNTYDYSGVQSQGKDQYEPEAVESKKRATLTKMDEDVSEEANEVTPAPQPVIIQFNQAPEVPFFATLPNKAAAEAFASLQAAGSIGSKYVDRLRGDQAPEKEVQLPIFKLSQEELLQPQKINLDTIQEPRTTTNVEIQKSVPLYETSYTGSDLLDTSLDDDLDFGEKIKPK